MSTAATRERNERAAIALEERQADYASARLAVQLAAAKLALDAVLAGPAVGAVLRNALIRVLDAVTPNVRDQLVTAMTLGWRLGRRQVLGPIAVRIHQDPLPDATLWSVVHGADERAQGRLEEAKRRADELPFAHDHRRADVDAVLKHAERAVAGVQTDAAWVTHRSIVLSKHVAAEGTGYNLVWVAERDACLNCLAYQGRVVSPRSVFPGGLTYGDHPLKPYGQLIGPPLHPNCRCQLDTTNLPAGSLDVGLAREAARSVARGLTDYASDSARFRAVNRLVSGTTGLPDAALIRLPKSVLARARGNAAAGSFRFRPDSDEARAAIRQRARDRARGPGAGRRR